MATIIFQDKLGQLQALVMQLLGERQMLHSYHGNQETKPNHIPNQVAPPGHNVQNTSKSHNRSEGGIVFQFLYNIMQM